MKRLTSRGARKPLLFVAAAALMALAPGLALAQANYGPGGQQQTSGQAEVTQAGANTTAGTTNGDSGPKKPSSGPNEASADLCQNYKGQAHTFCLDIETDQTSEQAGGNQQ